MKDKLIEQAIVALAAERGSDERGEAIAKLIQLFSKTSVAVADRDVYNQVNHAVLNSLMMLMKMSGKHISAEEDMETVAMVLHMTLDMWVKLLTDFKVNSEPLEDMEPEGGVQ